MKRLWTATLIVVASFLAPATEGGLDPGSRLSGPQRGSDALHWAAIRDQATSIERLLDRGVPIDAVDQFGRTPLMAAAAFGSEEAARLLLARGADALARDAEHGDTALHYAALAGHVAVARLLLEAGVGVNVPSGKSAATPLHHAAVHGRHRMIEFLVAEGANVMARDVGGSTPLQYASLRNRVPTIELLLQLGSRRDSLYEAAAAGDVRRVREFIREGTDLDARDMFGSPLHHAAARGQTYIAMLLLDAGADIELASEPEGLRALHVAAQTGSADTARLLIDRGADIEARDSQGRSPLMISATTGHIAIAEVLLDASADLYARDDAYGESALHLAAAAGYVDIVALLLYRGVPINLRSADDGESALHYATRFSKLEVVRYLAARGADLNVADVTGVTPLRLALSAHKRQAAYELLVSLGAH